MQIGRKSGKGAVTAVAVWLAATAICSTQASAFQKLQLLDGYEAWATDDGRLIYRDRDDSKRFLVRVPCGDAYAQDVQPGFDTYIDGNTIMMKDYKNSRLFAFPWDGGYHAFQSGGGEPMAAVKTGVRRQPTR